MRCIQISLHELRNIGNLRMLHRLLNYSAISIDSRCHYIYIQLRKVKFLNYIIQLLHNNYFRVFINLFGKPVHSRIAGIQRLLLLTSTSYVELIQGLLFFSFESSTKLRVIIPPTVLELCKRLSTSYLGFILFRTTFKCSMKSKSRNC